ncbi:hypothetical protein NQ314_018882 [Rhamnusium bicolor]|uniref:Disease resistance R13L4/SHOC-2-like LRR domain-containing protein n=1 Tax=Rhamnusium bicolor TaxID=1586634 RepID=A0AAV8WQ35_9CUCU|nr:hypothetical protein NQ314_018882 [Rhamnusium bicolor]
MDNYTSDSSDSDANSNKVIDFAYLLLEPETVENNLEAYIDDKKIIFGCRKNCGNGLKQISKNIWKLKNLQLVSFGGNELYEVPASLGQLQHLQALVLCDNKLESLPANIANLHKLKSLLLHKNKLRTLPPEIIALKNLTEVSKSSNICISAVNMV